VADDQVTAPRAAAPKRVATSAPARKPSKPYKANVRIEYPTDTGTVEVLPGEMAQDIPRSTVKPWLAQGIIEEVTN
jgi:hypothetical protein